MNNRNETRINNLRQTRLKFLMLIVSLLKQDRENIKEKKCDIISFSIIPMLLTREKI